MREKEVHTYIHTYIRTTKSLYPSIHMPIPKTAPILCTCTCDEGDEISLLIILRYETDVLLALSVLRHCFITILDESLLRMNAVHLGASMLSKTYQSNQTIVEIMCEETKYTHVSNRLNNANDADTPDSCTGEIHVWEGRRGMHTPPFRRCYALCDEAPSF